MTLLLTFLVHLTLLLSLAWLLTRTRKLGTPEVAETIWRTALFGSLLTTAVHLALGAPVWSTSLETAPPAKAALATMPPMESVPAVWGQPPTSAPVATETPAPMPAPASFEFDPTWLLLLWPLGVLALTTRRGLERRRLAKALRGREDVADPDARARLDDLAREAGVRRSVRLTACDALASPIAFGIRRPEICLPPRALSTLEEAERDAMLAHEVWHVRRADALWLAIGRTFQMLLFFHPLVHVAVRQLRDQAELLCDAWAAREAGQRKALARCLTEVAGWILERPTPEGVSAMALRPSLLGRRVRRLLTTPGKRLGRRAAVAAAMLPLALVLAFAPGLSRAEAEPQATVTLEDVDAELEALDRELLEVEQLLESTGRTELAERLRTRRLQVERKRARWERSPR